MALSVRYGAYRFRMPSLWPILLTIATLSLLIQLGFWQLHRAAWKEALLADFARADAGAAPAFAKVKATQFDALRFATVRIHGHFERPEVIYLDNRMFQGQLGYHVLGVFRADGHEPGLLVNLGWLPLEGGGRDRLPPVSLPQGEITFKARLSPIDQPLLALGTALDVRDGGRLVMPVLDRKIVADWLRLPLLPVEALLDPDAPFGFTRVWQAHYDIPPVKHRAYAFQWFALALAVVAIFVMVNTRRETAPDTGDTQPGENDD